MRLRIYDIDGTITRPGHDLWQLVTRSLAADPQRFDAQIERWRKNLNKGADPYQASRQMMQIGITGLNQRCTQDCIKERARELAYDLIQQQHYYSAAIEHICASLEAGFQIVFSTTNYHEAAAAFIEVLIAHHLIKPDPISLIPSGSIINWETRSIIHFNMGIDKVLGIAQILGISIDQLSAYTDSAYGDDPTGNDADILCLTQHAFVIANPRNAKACIAAHIVRTSWEKILTNYR